MANAGVERRAMGGVATDPDARLARKSNGQAAKLCYAWYVVMENRHGLAVVAAATLATGTAERDAGETMIAGLDRAGHSTLGVIWRDRGRVPAPDKLDYHALFRGG
jgi:hypothetical protein